MKLHKKGQLTLPVALRRQARIADGDVLDARIERGRITLTPQSLVDRQIAESERDYKEGRYYGPFDTAEEMIASLENELKKRAKKKGARK
ncbi:MAG: AbrB/MazE/SpoVT family DNA-binding domain-containing protein [Acidobacteria bacterium]|nr:AbrB/MazE/SpoVT family DNA-binding domain-containing protein [Acidobacteriota bacterium]